VAGANTHPHDIETEFNINNLIIAERDLRLLTTTTAAASLAVTDTASPLLDLCPFIYCAHKLLLAPRRSDLKRMPTGNPQSPGTKGVNKKLPDTLYLSHRPGDAPAHIEDVILFITCSKAESGGAGRGGG